MRSTSTAKLGKAILVLARKCGGMTVSSPCHDGLTICGAWIVQPRVTYSYEGFEMMSTAVGDFLRRNQMHTISR
ncbi:hypothetical protein ACP70R_033321 [Stipagrostis hirtigluma subsp. patula]